MFELLNLIPLPLTILTVVLIILPTIFTALLHVEIYNHLVYIEYEVRKLTPPAKSSEKQSKIEIVEKLKARFKEASSNLDEVNTAALVDGIYSQEKFRFFGCKLRCHQWDYFSQVLPNLLLSFGLLGTFLGIVINLSTLIQTINQVEDASNINSLITQLQTPLQGMGIAFLTSLIAIACSSLLTVVNLRWNTSLAREDLISSLEDYLDNILQPTIEGKSRLDKAVESMVKQQNNFLERFHNKVAEAVESSLGNSINQITEGNREASRLARQVYERFTESSGTISNAASKFELVVADFQNAVVNFHNSVVNDMRPTVEQFKQVAQTFDQSQFAQKLSEATTNLATTQNNFSNSALALEQTVQKIKDVVTILDNNSQNLVNLTAEIINQNQTSKQVFELHQTNQQSLKKIIPKLDKVVESFKLVFHRIEELQKRIDAREVCLGNIQSELANLVETLKEVVEQVGSSNQQQVETAMAQFHESTFHLSENIDKFGDRLFESLSEKLDSNSQQIQAVVEKIVEKIEESVGYLSVIESKFGGLDVALQSQVQSSIITTEVSNSDLPDNREQRNLSRIRLGKKH